MVAPFAGCNGSSIAKKNKALKNATSDFAQISIFDNNEFVFSYSCSPVPTSSDGKTNLFGFSNRIRKTIILNKTWPKLTRASKVVFELETVSRYYILQVTHRSEGRPFLLVRYLSASG